MSPVLHSGGSAICRAVAATVLLLLASACAKTGYRAHKVDRAPGGMVVSEHPLASAVGRDILAAGGSATDAAIATQFALAVVCPRAGNLGGGGFWVYAPTDDLVRTIDYRERAPGGATRDMYLRSDGTVDTDRALAGPLAAGIPGQVDGMWLAYTFGTRLNSWRTLVEPAARLARDGYRLSATEAERLNAYRAEFVAHNDFAFPFVRDEPWREGDLLRQPSLATTLDSVATAGAQYFYEGGFAERLAGEVRDRGGIWTAEDLSGYHSVFRDPIRVRFGPYVIYSMGPPSSGGVVLSQVLGMLAGYDLAGLHRSDTVAYYHLLIEAMRRAYADRATFLGDPDYVDVPVDSLLDANYLRTKWADFDPRRASVSGQTSIGSGRDVYETTHTSVVDAAGNAVSVTTTINGNFGCKTWSRVGGFFLNNEMDDFSAKPGVPNQFGLVGGEANAIAPGKRMLSSMTPTVVRRDSSFVLALGSPGGSTIITAVLQVLLNDLVHGQVLGAAVAAPRIHHQWLPDEVVYEPGALSPRVAAALRAMGHRLREASSIGRVKAVGRDGDVWIGAGDPRSPDDAAVGLQRSPGR